MRAQNEKTARRRLIRLPKVGRFCAYGSEPPECDLCAIKYTDTTYRVKREISRPHSKFNASRPVADAQKAGPIFRLRCPMARRQNRGMSKEHRTCKRHHSGVVGTEPYSYALTTSRSPQQYNNSPVDHGALWRGARNA